MKKIIYLCFCFVVMLLFPVQVNAASGKCTISGNSTVTVGSTIKITIKVEAKKIYTIKGQVSSSNNSVLSGGGNIYKRASLEDNPNGISTVSSTFVFKANAVGQAIISFVPNTENCIDINEEEITGIDKKITINVVEKSTPPPQTPNIPNTPAVDNRSKENSLSHLSVSEGSLSPDFSPSTTKYIVNVEGDKTKIDISAKAKDSKAKVSGIGTKELTIGKNTFVVVCTAENESQKKYTIEVHVDEKPFVYVDYNGEKLGIVRNLAHVGSPAGFEKGKIKIDNHEVDGWINEKINMILCYMVNEKGDKSFYVIEDEKVSYQFKKIQIDERNFYIIPLDDKIKKREGFELKTVQIGEVELEGWIYNNEAMKSYVQVYLMNELGEKHIYDYESKENQLQIYTVLTSEEKGINFFMISTILFALTSGILLVMHISFRKKSISEIKKYYENKQ